MGSRWRGVKLLTLYFAGYKISLLVLALLSPGRGYDTSTSLLETDSPSLLLEPPPRLANPILKLVRWDAIYFTALAARGRIFEQEWAFGLGLSGLISGVKSSSSRFPRLGVLVVLC